MNVFCLLHCFLLVEKLKPGKAAAAGQSGTSYYTRFQITPILAILLDRQIVPEWQRLLILCLVMFCTKQAMLGHDVLNDSLCWFLNKPV